MATEYIFFDADLCERFVQAVAARALTCQVRADAMEGFVVQLGDEATDAVLQALEADYEALMHEQMLRAETRPDWVSHQVAGVRFTRADGSSAVVRLPAAVARPLLERFTAEEAHDLVSAIAHSLEHPVDGPLCHKG
ncbi:MAG: hypothetical protein U9R55_07295 [Pseudomonadota bacterium]|nr:hypothetical protein [Pseudomonadota bacterium]